MGGDSESLNARPESPVWLVYGARGKRTIYRGPITQKKPPHQGYQCRGVDSRGNWGQPGPQPANSAHYKPDCPNLQNARLLYDDVRAGNFTDPFGMNIKPYEKEVDSTLQLAFTWSVFWFYLAIVIGLGALTFIL